MKRMSFFKCGILLVGILGNQLSTGIESAVAGTPTGTNVATATQTITGTKTGTQTSSPVMSPTVSGMSKSSMSAESTKSVTRSAANSSSLSPAAAPAQADAAEAQAFVYTTDSDTDAIQRAIEGYNRRFPNEPVKLETGNLSEDVIDRLIKYDFLKTPPKNMSNLRIREGRIFRRVLRDQSNPQTETGTGADSLFGAFEGASKKLNIECKKGTGNLANPNVRLEQRRVNVRAANGESGETTIVVPAIPIQPVKKGPTGRAAAPVANALTRQVLSPKYIAVPDKVSKGVASATPAVNPLLGQ
ncbi:MAG: hypothetical protein WA705_15275 [Candidatus Ozemobacteraceae bacterium]